MISVLAIRPEVHEFKSGQGNGFLMVIKIHSIPSFIGDVRPEAPCCEVLHM
jgi:hypothetical protein